MKTTLFGCTVLVCIVLTTNGFAQSRDGSIEDSWKNPSKDTAPVTRQDQPFLQGDKQYRNWDQKPQEPPRTWNQQPKKASPPAMSRDMYSSNAQLIDSLSTLYCLSSNYLTTLRNRNEASRGTVQPMPTPPRDFSYQQRTTEQKPLPGRESPEALRKELLQLLDQCLYGRY
jgi:hypothetical protein